MRPPIDSLVDLNHTEGLLLLPHSYEIETIWDITIGWHPDDDQYQQFQALYHAVLQGNKALNLTRIIEPEDFLEKHLWDSISGIRAFLNADVQDENSQSQEFADSSQNTSRLTDQALSIIDIGTGAGFPGLPVAIACPQWQVTLLDSTRKKTTFLDSVIKALKLPNVSTLTDRVETTGRKSAHREQYDIALLRAVAPASVCAEYALPLLKLGGWAVLYRGHWEDEETTALLTALEMLGGDIEMIDPMQTPFSGSDRHCILLRKIAPTPKEFPRSIGVPSKEPL